MKRLRWIKLVILMALVLQVLTGCNFLGLDDDDDEQISIMIESPDSTLFVMSSTGKYIAAFNYISGVEIKQNFVELKSESVAENFCLWEDKILVAATNYNALHIYDAKSGSLLKEVNLGEGVKPAFVIATGGAAYVSATEGAKKLHRVDLTDYEVISVAGGDCLQNVYYNEADDLLYVSDIQDMYNPAGKLLVFDPISLAEEKRYENISQNPGAIIYDEGKILVACAGKSWSDPLVDGAIAKFDVSGVYTKTSLVGSYPSRLVSYQNKVYANAGFGVAGLFNALDVSDKLEAIDYSVNAMAAKDDYLVTTESNWCSDDGKAHFYIYKEGVEVGEFLVGDCPSCVRFYKK